MIDWHKRGDGLHTTYLGKYLPKYLPLPHCLTVSLCKPRLRDRIYTDTAATITTPSLQAMQISKDPNTSICLFWPVSRSETRR